MAEREGAPRVDLRDGVLLLQARPGTDAARRRDLVERWHRARMKEAVQPLLAHWETRIGVKAKRFRVRRMKTRWGSCNRRVAGILLNTELSRRPPGCLEYVLVHELVHLLERTHGPPFVSLMDRFLPDWKQRRKLLNRSPAREA